MKHHKINYIEFPAKDITATKDFYSKAFDWKFTDYGPTYSSFADGIIDGGFDSTEKVTSHTGPLVILYSENLEKSLEQVASSGGKITKQIFEFPGGRRFQFSDPNGNELAIWTDK